MNFPITNPKPPLPAAIPQLQELLATRGAEVTQWFEAIRERTPPFFYNSVDLRHSGFKLAPVDTNLFPAGFNNLNATERTRAEKQAASYFQRYHPDMQRVLVLAEDHTRNKYYLDNLVALRTIIEKAGKEVVISNLSTTVSGEAQQLESGSAGMVDFIPLVKQNGRVQTTDGFIPDFILMNNDLTSGAPDLLADTDQLIVPPLGFGWHQRRKTSHFETYTNLARQFCQTFGLDPWLITTFFQRCGVVDFKERKGLECVALRVDQTIGQIRAKYEEYGITEEPYVFIKSDRGTYGMGIMTARSGEELYEMSKNIRKQMHTIKGGVQNTEVIIQEGIPTIDAVGEHPAEPMIYMIGAEPVGCIYRLNTRKDSYGNLNASGMQFDSIANHSSDRQLCSSLGLVAKLAACAAAWECYEEQYHI